MRKSKRLMSGMLGLTCAMSLVTMPVSAAEGEQRPVTKHELTDCRGEFPLLKIDSIPNHFTKQHSIFPLATADETDTPVEDGEAYLPLLVICVGFEDVPYSDDHNIADDYFAGDYSITSFYHDQSFGQFTFLPAEENCASGKDGNTNQFDKENDGIVHVKLPTVHGDMSDMVYHDGSSDEEIAAYQQAAFQKEIDVFTAAIEAADSYVDFSAYDTDGDGYINNNELALDFIVAGYDAAYAFERDEEQTPKDIDRSQYVWAHASSISTQNYLLTGEFPEEEILPHADGVAVDRYIEGSEYKIEDDRVYEGIAAVAHELGHYIGLKDYYDTSYNEDGEWDGYTPDLLSLMCAGNYQYVPDTDSYMPASLDPYSKWVLGWIEIENTDWTGTYTIDAPDYGEVSTPGSVLRIPTQHENEYYLVENRQPGKWDCGLTYTHVHDNELGPENKRLTPEEIGKMEGLIFWHIEDEVYVNNRYTNEVNVSMHRPAITPLYMERTDKDDVRSECVYFGEKPSLLSGFFSKSVWENGYKERLGDTLNLPVYGDGEDADKRDARWFSGITVDFLDDSAPSMQIKVDFDNYIRKIGYSPYFEPTSTSYGFREYWFDSVLGEYYADENGEELIEGDYWEVIALPPLEEEPVEEPTEDAEQPTEPAEDTEQPTEPAEEPTEDTEQPTEHTEEPTDDTEQPTEPVADATDTTEPEQQEPTLPEGSYSLDELCDMALKDYEQKNGTRPENAAAIVNEDGTVTIQLSDEFDGHVSTADYYTVDPKTGIGTNNAGEEVNLPQTGMSGVYKTVAGLAVLMSIAGVVLVKKSRKEEKE